MDKKIILYVFNEIGSPIKAASFSRAGVLFSGLFLTICFFITSMIIYDYCLLKKTFFGTQKLMGTVSQQKDEITFQRRQIQNYAHKINRLKSDLQEFQKFEEKIRIVADLEESANSSAFFGVGGSSPADLDPGLSLNQNHHDLMRSMHHQLKKFDRAAGKQREGLESLLKNLEKRRNLLASTPSIRPVKGWLSSRFGNRLSPFTGRREFHRGIDIVARRGAPVLASADGILVFAGKKGLMGNMIVIDHAHGMVTRYGHLQKILKKNGSKIKRGDVIAQVGSTGRTTGPHLHYEVFINGLPVNPSKYILN